MEILTWKRFFALISIMFVVFVIVVLVCLFFGPTTISLKRVLDTSIPLSANTDAVIFFRVRLPRVILAGVVGAALACAGLVFQALLRNPLATPYTLGVSSGASLGAVIAIHLNITFTIFNVLSAITLFSFVGATLTVTLVYLLSKRKGTISITTLLLAGVTLNFFFAAIILFMQYVSDFTQSIKMIRWMMGGLDITDYRIALGIIPIVLCMLTIIFTLARKLNLISVDVQTATHLGVNVEVVRTLCLFVAALMTGAVVSLSGPIGFVGLIIPHILRLLIGSDHRLLIPCSVFAGGAFLVICDTIARTILPPIELPVGILTAMFGGPFFLWLLLRRKHGILGDI